MSFGAILLLALGLAMDATAAAATRGMSVPHVRARHVLLVAGLFGGFQALMPLLGFCVGRALGRWVEAWDHWIAFALLSALGAKMIWEAFREEHPDARSLEDPFNLKVMLVLAVATSLDAFAAGTMLPMLGAPFVLSLATIGVTTALLSVLGLYAGRRFGTALGSRLDVAGGLVLIGLGTNILVTHLNAS